MQLIGLPVQTDLFSVTQVEREPIVLFVRTDRPLPGPEPELVRYYQGIEAVFARWPTEDVSLIVDVRRAPGRNDAVFEKVQARFRKRVFFRFARTVVVVRSDSGRLQVDRYAREDRSDQVPQFTNRLDAIAALRSGARSDDD